MKKKLVLIREWERGILVIFKRKLNSTKKLTSTIFKKKWKPHRTNKINKSVFFIPRTALILLMLLIKMDALRVLP